MTNEENDYVMFAYFEMNGESDDCNAVTIEYSKKDIEKWVMVQKKSKKEKETELVKKILH
jgi:succinate dehydrogenase flavin-adding protein (antitoxin of CptAB toxin-antitoxin module)